MKELDKKDYLAMLGRLSDDNRDLRMENLELRVRLTNALSDSTDDREVHSGPVMDSPGGAS